MTDVIKADTLIFDAGDCFEFWDVVHDAFANASLIQSGMPLGGPFTVERSITCLLVLARRGFGLKLQING